MSGFAELCMLVTKLLSKYLAKQNAEQKAVNAKQEHAKPRLSKVFLNDSVQTEFEKEPEVVVMTASEADELRDKFRQAGQVISPTRILQGQLAVGVLLALLAWCVTGKPNVAYSVGYGALAVVIPAALFARGLMSQFSSLNALTAGFGFFVWEMIKIVVSVVLIAIAPKLVVDLDWLAMLIGLIVTMKVVFVLLWLLPKLAKNTAAL
jgi:ATP synthase protein I